MPPAVSFSDALPSADDSETAALLKNETWRVLGNCRALKSPDSLSFGGFDQGLQQPTPNALAARNGCDVDADFCNAGVARAIRDRTERSPSQHSGPSCDQSRMRQSPCVPLIPGWRGCFKATDSRRQTFFVDPTNVRPVTRHHRVDPKCHASILSAQRSGSAAGRAAGRPMQPVVRPQSGLASDHISAAMTFLRVAKSGRNIGQPDHSLVNPVTSDKAERRPGSSEIWLAVTKDDRMQVDSIFIDQAKFG